MKSTTEVVNKLTVADVVESFYLKGMDAENKKDIKSAEMYYNFAAKKDCPKSLCGLGRICNARNDKKNADMHYQKAAKIYHTKARNGCLQSLFSLGCMHQKGHGTPVNLEEAFKYYKVAADKGHADAQCALADMYMKGLGTPINFELAFHYYQESSNQDNAKADFELSTFYFHGKVVEKDLDINCKLLHKSANAGFAHAQYAIGVLFYFGTKAIYDKKAGLKYLKRAAEQGHIEGLRSAGIAFYQDLYEQDVDLARKYLEQLRPKDRKISDRCILGIIYYNGLGDVVPDKIKGKACFGLAVSAYKSTEDLAFLSMAEAYIGISLLDTDCGEKDVKKAHWHFFRVVARLAINNLTLKNVASIIQKGIEKLDFADLSYLILRYFETTDTSPNPNSRTYIYPENYKFLYDIYVEAIKLCAQREELTPEKQSFVNNLPVLEAYPPERAFMLAICELTKTEKEVRAEHLKDYLVIPCSHEDFGTIYAEGLYYLGIYFLINFLHDPAGQKTGMGFIQSSAKKEYLPAKNYLKFIDAPKKDKDRINILIDAGKNAEKNKIYQVAKFYYNKALSLDRSKENLLRCALLEGHIGEKEAATRYFSELLRKYHEPEIVYLALEFFTQNDIKQAVNLLDGEDSIYRRITKEAEKNTWQEALYCLRELHVAERLFDNNKMVQGFKHIKQSADRGYTDAILDLAFCYLEGWGVKSNEAEAEKLLFSIEDDAIATYYRGIVTIDKGNKDIFESVLSYFRLFEDTELIQEYVAHADSAAGFIHLGNKACKIHFFRIATFHYTQALKLEPENAEALFRMGFCYMQWDEYDIALEYLEKALQLDKTHEQAQMAEAMCCMKLGIVRAQTEPVFLMTEEPVQEVMPEPESFQPVKMSRKVRKKRVQNSESRNISSYKDSIFSCTTSEQFMDIFYKITASSPPVSLRESMKTWVDEHAEYQYRILQILKEKGDLYAEYIEEWGLHALENRVTETAVSMPVIEPVEVPVIPQIPNAKKSSTEVRPTLKEKRQIKDMHARNRKITDMIGKLHWIPEYKELLAELHRYMNQQITSDILHGNEALKFAECIHAFQDRRNYKILCDVYAFFTLEERNMHQYPAELHKYFLDIQIIMQDVHRGIEILMEQSYVFCNKFCFEYRPEMYASINNINRLYSVFNGFHTDRTAMNKELKQKNAARIFSPVPLVVGDIYTLFEPACEALFVAGSFLRKQYEQSQNPLDTDLDIVLINPDIKKLIELRCARNIHITDKEVYTFQYGRSRSHWIPVDILCIRKPANMPLEEILLEDIKLRDLKSALHGNSLGAIKNTSGVAFHHLDNHIIDIPGNSIERAHQEPLLMLRVIAEELRIMLQFRKKPEIAENVLIAFKTFTRNPDFEKQEGHIHAFMRKCIKKYGAVDMAKKLVEYGLLHHLFEITHEEDWGKTASLLEKKVTKEFLPVQVAVKENSALVLSSIFQPEKKDEVLDEKRVELGFGSSK